MAMIQRIAVLTSGGDAPGMNAAIRAVVRSASVYGIEVMGVQDGYAGLATGRWQPLDNRSVGHILERGGTMLGSARFPSFRERAVQQAVIKQLEAADIGGLIVIGGNGSQQGTLALHRLGFPAIGIASTIDNDLGETEITIGVDTALNTSMTYVDRLRDTATSHRRTFVVEVMGRDSGYIAVMTAIATGGGLVIVPERATTLEEVAHDIDESFARGKSHYIAIVAEGAQLRAQELTAYLSKNPSYETRLSVLGHVQRGGSPTVADRALASQLGVAAVGAMVAGDCGKVIGRAKGEIRRIPLEVAVKSCQKVTPELLELADVLVQ